MKRNRLFTVWLALVLLLGMAQPAFAADTAATMQLSITEGTVAVSNASGRSLTLRDNMRLYSGYQVETAASSYAWINLDSTKLVKLDASTKVEIRKSGKKLEVLLKSGNMYGDVSKPLEADETLDIRTSTAIVGIRGTKFSVAQVKQAGQDADAVPWKTQVQVYEGTVSVKAQQETSEAQESPAAMVTTTITAGTQLIVNPGAQEAGIFEESPMSTGDVSGYAAVELAKDPAVLENLGIDLTQENAQVLLEQDQADAAQRQAAADAGKTGLETAAAPNVVWETDSGSTPSDNEEDTARPERDPDPEPEPTPNPIPDPEPEPKPAYTVMFDPNGGAWNGDAAARSAQADTSGLLAAANIPADPVRTGYTFTGWYTAATGGTAVDPVAYTFTANTTLYAQWSPVPADTYTVTFDPNGGAWSGDATAQSVQTDTSGLLAAANIPADPVRTGYTFTGWYTAASGGTAVDPVAYTFTANTTLYAQWSPVPADTYTVTFDPNGGAWNGDAAAQSVQTDTSGLLAAANIPADPVQTGYTFTGWYTAASGGTAVDPVAYTFTANTTLYAQWSPVPADTYTVTFDPNGGAWSGDAAPKAFITDADGLLTSSVPDPSYVNYIFDGWYTSVSGGREVDLTAYTFTADTTLYAQWIPLYTITFDPNGGAWSGDTAPKAFITDTSGLLAAANIPADPVRSGYAFTGWYTSVSGGTEVDPAAAFTADTTLYAQWIPLYTITFDPNGGILTGDSTAITSSKGTLSTLPTPTRNANTDATAAYTFSGWYTAAEGGTEVTTGTTFSANTTVYAHWTMDSGWDWELNSGALRISGSGAMADFAASSPPWNASDITSVTIDSGVTNVGMNAFNGCTNLTSVTLPEGLESIGSYAFANCTSLTAIALPATLTSLGTNYTFLNCTKLDNVVIPSQVTEISQYIFEGCAGLRTVTIPANVKIVDAEAFKDCTGLTDITFTGTKAQWNAFSYKAPANVTVTCSDGILPEYVVTFDSQGGSAVASQTVDKGGTATKPADPTQSGYAFGGWSLDGATAYDFSTPVTGDITLTALWKQIYTITLDPNGGTWADGSTVAKTFQTGYDGKITEIPAEPTRNGYAMMWYDNNNVMRSLESTFAENITLTAQWKEAQEVVFDPNGGTWADGSTASKTLYTDWDGYVYPPVPTKEGYTLSGWKRDGGMGDLISPDDISSTRFTAADLLYADWAQTT